MKILKITTWETSPYFIIYIYLEERQWAIKDKQFCIFHTRHINVKIISMMRRKKSNSYHVSLMYCLLFTMFIPSSHLLHVCLFRIFIFRNHVFFFLLSPFSTIYSPYSYFLHYSMYTLVMFSVLSHTHYLSWFSHL